MRAIALAVLILCLTCTQVNGQFHEETLKPTSVCYDVLEISQIMVPDSYSCQDNIENAIEDMPTLWAALTETCRNRFADYICKKSFVPWPTGESPCKSTCDQVVSACDQGELDAIYAVTAAAGSAVNVTAECPTLSTTSCTEPYNSTVPNVQIPSCQTYPSTFTGTYPSACDGIVDYDVYIPRNFSLASFEALASVYVEAFCGAQYVSPDCLKATARYVCQQVYQKCDTAIIGAHPSDGSSIQYPLPRLPCKHVCTTYEEKCAALYASTPMLVPNCTSVGNIIQTDVLCTVTQYPEEDDWLPNTGASCNEITANVSVNALAVCPAATCDTIPSDSVCASILNYDTAWYPYPTYSCINELEDLIDSLPTLWESLTPICAEKMAAYICLKTYRPCDDATKNVCQPRCQEVVDACTATDIAKMQALGVDFSTECDGLPYSSDECYNPDLGSDSVAEIPSCETYTGSFCSSIVDYEIYVPAGYTQASLEALVLAGEPATYIASTGDDGCLYYLLDYLCSRVFNKCDRTPAAGLGLDFAFPKFPCYSQCKTFQEKCASLFALVPTLEPNCLESGTYLNQTNVCGELRGTRVRDWPEGTYTISTLNDFALNTDCYPGRIETERASQYSTLGYNISAAEALSASAPSVECPGGLVPPAEGQEGIFGGSCMTPCPSLFYTEEEWDSAHNFILGLTIISITIGLWIWLTWVIFPVKRKQSYIMWFLFCLLMIAFQWTVVVIHYGSKGENIANINCKSPSELIYNKEDDVDGLCYFQSSFMTFFAQAAVSWWLIQSFDVYAKVVLGWSKKFKIRKIARIKTIAYHSFAWGHSFLELVVFLAQDGFEGNLAVSWCATAGDLSWGLFYYPIIIQGLVGSFFMSSIIYSLFISSKRTSSHSKPGWWKKYVRPICFIIMFLIIWIIIVSYKVMAWANEDEYEQSYIDYVGCLLSGSQTCGDHVPSRPDTGLWYALIFAVVGQSILTTLLYGTIDDNCKLWKNLITKRTVHKMGNQSSQSLGASRAQDTTRGSSINTRSSMRSNYSQRVGGGRNKPKRLGTGGGGGNGQALKAMRNKYAQEQKAAAKLDDIELETVNPIPSNAEAQPEPLRDPTPPPEGNVEI